MEKENTESKPFVKPHSVTGIFKMPAKPTATTTSKQPSTFLFKTPLKSRQIDLKSSATKTPVNNGTSTKPSGDLVDMAALIKEEMSSMNADPLASAQISSSASKPVRNPAGYEPSKTLDGIATPRRVYTPLFATNLKYDPKCVTGIPLIKSKKPTIPKPFSFSSDKLAAKRAAKIGASSK